MDIVRSILWVMILPVLCVTTSACGQVNLPDTEPECGNGVQEEGEECDDHNNANDDGCSSACVFEEWCGDGTVQYELGEECDDGNPLDRDGCSSECITEICGDGVTQAMLGEECDDGNTTDGDGCSAQCQMEEYGPCGNPSNSVLANADFETGEVFPWVSDGNPTIEMFSHEGSWAVQIEGNYYLKQEFSSIPVSSLKAARFWTWHDPDNLGPLTIEWTYADGTADGDFYDAFDLAGWQQIDLISVLDSSKSIRAIQVWGYTGQVPPFVARFDLFEICI